MRNRIKPQAQQADAAPVATDLPRSVEKPNPKLDTIVERANDPTGEGKLVSTPIRGGSYGVIPEAVQRIGIHVGKPKPRDESIHKLPKKYIITGPTITAPGHPYAGKVTFMYTGYRVYVNPGKEVTENMYDLDYLRRQGVKMDEIVDPASDDRDEEIHVPIEEETLNPTPEVQAAIDTAREKTVADHAATLRNAKTVV